MKRNIVIIFSFVAVRHMYPEENSEHYVGFKRSKGGEFSDQNVFFIMFSINVCVKQNLNVFFCDP